MNFKEYIEEIIERSSDRIGMNNFKDTAQKAIDRAKSENKKQSFKFNGKTYTVTGKDSASDMLKKYQPHRVN